MERKEEDQGTGLMCWSPARKTYGTEGVAASSEQAGLGVVGVEMEDDE